METIASHNHHCFDIKTTSTVRRCFLKTWKYWWRNKDKLNKKQWRKTKSFTVLYIIFIISTFLVISRCNWCSYIGSDHFQQSSKKLTNCIDQKYFQLLILLSRRYTPDGTDCLTQWWFLVQKDINTSSTVIKSVIKVYYFKI